MRCIAMPWRCWATQAELKIASGARCRNARPRRACLRHRHRARATCRTTLFEGDTRLKAAIRHGAGLDMIPVEAATKAGVLVANVPGANASDGGRACDICRPWRCCAAFARLDRDLRSKGWLAGRATMPKAATISPDAASASSAWVRSAAPMRPGRSADSACSVSGYSPSRPEFSRWCRAGANRRADGCERHRGAVLSA